jgi:hypothetical protein
MDLKLNLIKSQNQLTITAKKSFQRGTIGKH